MFFTVRFDRSTQENKEYADEFEFVSSEDGRLIAQFCRELDQNKMLQGSYVIVSYQISEEYEHYWLRFSWRSLHNETFENENDYIVAELKKFIDLLQSTYDVMGMEGAYHIIDVINERDGKLVEKEIVEQAFNDQIVDLTVTNKRKDSAIALRQIAGKFSEVNRESLSKAEKQIARLLMDLNFLTMDEFGDLVDTEPAGSV